MTDLFKHKLNNQNNRLRKSECNIMHLFIKMIQSTVFISQLINGLRKLNGFPEVKLALQGLQAVLTYLCYSNTD